MISLKHPPSLKKSIDITLIEIGTVVSEISTFKHTNSSTLVHSRFSSDRVARPTTDKL